MYRALESFTTKNYDVKRKQILEDDFTTQDEINEFLAIGYIEVYDGSIEITENGVYDVEDYETADVDVAGVQPTGELSITTNGTYDVVNYATANVQVAGGNQPAKLLQWIESPGGNTANLINIDMIPAMNDLAGMRFEIDYQFLGTAIIGGTEYANEVGCGQYSNTRRFTVDYPNNSDYFGFSVGTAITTSVPKDTERHTFIIDTHRKIVMVDNNSANITATTFDSTESFNVFGRTAGGISGFAGPSKFYGLKIYHVDYFNKQYLMQDIVPAKNSNGDIALFDKINNKYYKPIGTPVTLIAGPEV